MKVINKTGHDGRTVRSIVRWVANELDVTVDEVEIREHLRSHPYHGIFYPGQMKIIAQIAAPDIYPAHPHDRGFVHGPPPIVASCWQEALVGILAHEFFHARQKMTSSKKRKYSEVEAEWAEYRLWRRWKERTT